MVSVDLQLTGGVGQKLYVSRMVKHLTKLAKIQDTPMKIVASYPKGGKICRLTFAASADSLPPGLDLDNITMLTQILGKDLSMLYEFGLSPASIARKWSSLTLKELLQISIRVNNLSVPPSVIDMASSFDPSDPASSLASSLNGQEVPPALQDIVAEVKKWMEDLKQQNEQNETPNKTVELGFGPLLAHVESGKFELPAWLPKLTQSLAKFEPLAAYLADNTPTESLGLKTGLLLWGREFLALTAIHLRRPDGVGVSFLFTGLELEGLFALADVMMLDATDDKDGTDQANHEESGGDGGNGDGGGGDDEADGGTEVDPDDDRDDKDQFHGADEDNPNINDSDNDNDNDNENDEKADEEGEGEGDKNDEDDEEVAEDDENDEKDDGGEEEGDGDKDADDAEDGENNDDGDNEEGDGEGDGEGDEE